MHENYFYSLENEEKLSHTAIESVYMCIASLIFGLHFSSMCELAGCECILECIIIVQMMTCLSPLVVVVGGSVGGSSEDGVG